MSNIIVFIIIIVVVMAIKLFAGAVPQRIGTTTYRRERFMSDAEVRFYKALYSAVGTQSHIFVKPRLNDIVSALDSNRSAWQVVSNKLRMKHVDFLLCDPLTLTPACAVELDDSTHTRSDRQDRDNFVNEVLKSAGIPIAHFVVRSTYTLEDISHKLAQVLPGWSVPQAMEKTPSPSLRTQTAVKTDLPPKSRAVLIPTEPPPANIPKDLKYMPPALRADYEKKNT